MGADRVDYRANSDIFGKTSWEGGIAVKRVVGTTKAETTFQPGLPIMINRVSESFELEEHSHEFVEISYVSEGSGFHYIEGNTLAVAKGDLFFIPIGASHVFRPASVRPRQQHLIVYNCVFTAPYIERLNNVFLPNEKFLHLLQAKYPEQSWFQIQDYDGVFQETFNRLFEEYTQRKPDFELILQADVIRLLVEMQRHALPALPSSPKTVELLEPVLKRIHDNFEQPLPLAELAAMAGLGDRQFRRVFTLHTGMALTSYIQKLRMEKCCSLLLTTSDSISSIAQSVGYQDIKFFNRLFKKTTGMTPRQYRNRRGGFHAEL
jgi:AraC family L-rhamnose operon transcriptional activator RhaR